MSAAGVYDPEPVSNDNPYNLTPEYNLSSFDGTTTDYDDRSRMYNDLYSNVYPAGYSRTKGMAEGNIPKYIILIDVLTDGDFKTNTYDPIPFHPNMTVNTNQYSSANIIFAPIVELRLQDVIALAGLLGDYKVYFTNTKYFLKLLRAALKDSSRHVASYDDIIQRTAAFKQIVQSNLDLLRQVFFPDNGPLTVMGQEYKIRSSTIVANTYKSEKNQKSDPVPLPLRYYVTMKLQIYNASRDLPLSGKTCKEQAKEIDETCVSIFGKTCGFSSLEKLPPITIQPTPTRKVTAALGPVQHEWERRNGVKRSNQRTAAEENIIRILKDLERLDQQYQQINPQWLAETEQLHEQLTDVADLIDANDTNQRDVTDKYTTNSSSRYYPTKLKELQRERTTLLKQEADLEKQMKEIDMKYTETLSQSADDQKKEIQQMDAELQRRTLELQSITDPKKRTQKTQDIEQLKKAMETKMYLTSSSTGIRKVDEWHALIKAIKLKKADLDELKGRQTKDDKARQGKATAQKTLFEIGEVHREIERINYDLQPNRNKRERIDVKQLFAKKQQLTEKRNRLLKQLKQLIPDKSDLIQQLKTVNIIYDDIKPSREYPSREYEGGTRKRRSRRRVTIKRRPSSHSRHRQSSCKTRRRRRRRL